MAPLKEDDVILITDDNKTRGQWRLGKVVKTLLGADGLVRTVRLQTKEGLVNRPVQRLHLLEEHKETVRTSQSRTETEGQQVSPSSKQQDQPKDPLPSPNQVPRSKQKKQPKNKVKTRQCEPQNVKNGSTPFVGEDVQARRT